MSPHSRSPIKNKLFELNISHKSQLCDLVVKGQHVQSVNQDLTEQITALTFCLKCVPVLHVSTKLYTTYTIKQIGYILTENIKYAISVNHSKHLTNLSMVIKSIIDRIDG
jgi:hypothetical protein